MPSLGLELRTWRAGVARSADGASQAPLDLVFRSKCLFRSGWIGVGRDFSWSKMGLCGEERLTAPLDLESVELDKSRCVSKSKILILKMVCQIPYLQEVMQQKPSLQIGVF